MESIADALSRVRERISTAAHQSGRDPRQIRLIAVSKRKSADAVREAYAAGQRDFGENYVQELVEKADRCRDLPDIRWHLIGHLQRNKVKNALGVVSVVHTVDSIKLARELGKRAAERPGADRLPVLAEVNVGREAQKSGISPADLGGLLATIEQEPALQLCGLMTVPPLVEHAETTRPYFDELAGLREQHGGSERLPELSMGMTQDLEVAIAAGATIVRVGTAIFGIRH